MLFRSLSFHFVCYAVPFLKHRIFYLNRMNIFSTDSRKDHRSRKSRRWKLANIPFSVKHREELLWLLLSATVAVPASEAPCAKCNLDEKFHLPGCALFIWFHPTLLSFVSLFSLWLHSLFICFHSLLVLIMKKKTTFIIYTKNDRPEISSDHLLKTSLAEVRF